MDATNAWVSLIIVSGISMGGFLLILLLYALLNVLIYAWTHQNDPPPKSDKDWESSM